MKKLGIVEYFKRFIKGTGIIFGVIILYFMGFHIIPNNIILYRMRADLRKVGSPPGTEKISELKYIGNIVGNGDKCNIIVAFLYVGDYGGYISHEYYVGKKIKGAYKGQPTGVNLGFYKNGEFDIHPFEYRNAYSQVEKLFFEEFDFENKCPEDKLCYTVFVLDTSDYVRQWSCY